MRVDARHCLSTPAAQWRCVVLDDREKMMMDPRPDCSGRTLVQRMEDRLDELVWNLMIGQAAGFTEGPEYAAKLRGETVGVAYCIALVRTPYAPDVDAVRAAAMERYQATLVGAS